MSSFTITQSATFTITHARHMAAKVSADLKRMQRFYGFPNDADIASYESEVIELLKAGYFGTLTVGFLRDNQWVEPTLRYTSRDLAGLAGVDDDPGRVPPGHDLSRATFFNYLTYSAAWDELAESDKDAFKRRMPVNRTGMAQPTVKGYLVDDKSYSSGGRSLSRASVRSY